MEINNPTRKTNFLSKISSILFGILVTSIILASSIQFFRESGIWIGIILTIIIAVTSFKYSKKGSILRIMSYGMIGTILGSVVFYFVTLSLLNQAYEGF